MIPRLCNISKKQSFFLFGPRGVGKSTLLRTLFDPSEIYTVDLLDYEVENRLSLNPSRVLEEWEALPEKTKKSGWILIDEIQRIPKLLDVVHRGIEGKKLKFALTGSSARKLRRGSANLLAGRAIEYRLHPLSTFELGEHAKQEDMIQWGSLPGLLNLENDDAAKRRFLNTYVNTYLREEIQAEQIVRRMDPFRMFLEVAASANGKILNVSKLARQCGIDPKSAQRYFEILADTLIGFYLPAWDRSVRKRQAQHPKFYFFDIGVARSAAQSLHVPIVPGTYEYGKYFEHLVILEAIRLNDYLETGYQFSYLQTQTNLEIDLILTRGRSELIAIEIKSTDPTNEEIQKLLDLTEGIRHCRRYILCNIKTPYVDRGVRILNWQQGLREIFP